MCVNISVDNNLGNGNKFNSNYFFRKMAKKFTQ